MADFYRYLPLSPRSAVDESGVSRDWRGRTADTASLLADRLETVDLAAWSAPSMRPRSAGTRSDRARDRLPVQEVVEHLVWRLGSSRLELVFPSPPEERTPAELIARLRADALRRRAGAGRKGLGELSAVVTAAFDVTLALGLPSAVDRVSSGAVALGRALTAPTPIRAVLRGHSLTATDAAWTIGAGPELRGTAGELVLWLYGRSTRPEAAPRTRP